MTPDPLDEFEARLNAARQQSNAQQGLTGSQSGLSQQDRVSFQRGMRIGCDLLAGVGLGVFLGLAVDRTFETRPFGLLIMFVIGSVAGMWNVFRTLAGYDYAVGFRKSAENNADGTESNSKHADRPKDV